MSEIINKIRKIVQHEDNVNLFKSHISLVVSYANKLAEIESEDIEAIEIAALLHDIGKMRYGGKEHNLTGAKDARKILEKENYPEEKIEKIYNAIVSHRGKEEFPAKDKFGKILQCADGLSHQDIVPLMLMLRLKKTNNNLVKSIKKTMEKLEFEWNNKITKIVAPSLYKKPLVF